MAQGIGAGGFVGIALETTAGTYTAPTKYFPIKSESLKVSENIVYRRPIRQSADIINAKAGNETVDGDIMMEAFEDVVPYFLRCSRSTVVKTGTTPNYTYTSTPSSAAIAPDKTMSVTVVRNGVVFGYAGVVVTNMKFSIEDGILMFNVGLIGLTEATQTLPTPTFITTDVFGAGQYQIQIPTATQVYDIDSFEFSVEDGGEAQFRLKDTNRGASFVKYGEREVTLTAERDFDTKTDYDAFKALTSQSITLVGTKGTNNSITITMATAIKDEYSINLGGQGDLLRGSISYKGVLASGSAVYTIVVKTQENIA